MPFWNSEFVELEKFRPGILSKAEIGNDLIMAIMQIDAEKEDGGHVHSFDQCGIVLGGQIEMVIGNDSKLLRASDCYFIPAGELHGWRTLSEKAKILDISLKQP